MLDPAGLQPRKPLLVLLNPRSQLENELDTYFPAGVIDRLRLGTIQARKIRCTNKESQPKARRLNGYGFPFSKADG